MPAQLPKSVVSVFSTDHLVDVIESNEFGPEINEEMAQRIIDVAQQRVDSRSSLEDGDIYLVMTTWDNFCRDTFGSSNGSPNRFALASIDWEVSAQNNAYLCNDGVSIQQGWLESGDGRMSQLEEIDVSDTEYVDEAGTYWAPKDYISVINFSDELVEPNVDISEAM